MVLILFLTVPARAQMTTRKNNGVQKESLFARASDWFATVGKTQKEKNVIKKERRASRKIKKAKQNIARQKKQLAD